MYNFFLDYGGTLDAVECMNVCGNCQDLLYQKLFAQKIFAPLPMGLGCIIHILRKRQYREDQGQV